MKVIIKNGANYELQGTPELAENEMNVYITNLRNSHEEVITDYEITAEQLGYIERGATFSYIDGEIVIEQTEIDRIEDDITLGEKQKLVDEARKLKRLGQENMSAYLAQETISVEIDEHRQLKLDKLALRGEELTTQFIAKQTALIATYGISVLDELI